MKRLIIAVFILLLTLTTVYAEATPIDQLVYIPARADFAFVYDLTNRAEGEVSPIIKDYYLSSVKVTNAEYKAFTDATGHRVPKYWIGGNYPEGKTDHPVVSVSYSDAVAYCEWLTNQYEGWVFRLPTEAEWENAARGTYYSQPETKYPTGIVPVFNAKTMTIQSDFNYNGIIASELLRTLGDDYIVTYTDGEFKGETETLADCISISKNGGVTNWANHGGNATRGYFLQTDLYDTVSANGGNTTPVDYYPANTLGLYDMAGNCWDLTSSIIIANNGLEQGVECYAVRGGSWYATSRSCTMTYRGEGRKDHPSATVGFRIAAEKVIN